MDQWCSHLCSSWPLPVSEGFEILQLRSWRHQPKAPHVLSKAKSDGLELIRAVNILYWPEQWVLYCDISKHKSWSLAGSNNNLKKYGCHQPISFQLLWKRLQNKWPIEKKKKLKGLLKDLDTEKVYNSMFFWWKMVLYKYQTWTTLHTINARNVHELLTNELMFIHLQPWSKLCKFQNEKYNNNNSNTDNK